MPRLKDFAEAKRTAASWSTRCRRPQLPISAAAQ